MSDELTIVKVEDDWQEKLIQAQEKYIIALLAELQDTSIIAHRIGHWTSSRMVLGQDLRREIREAREHLGLPIPGWAEHNP